MVKAGWALAAILAVPAAFGQQQPAADAAKPKVDRASSYYHYALAHMYAELASAYGARGGYLDKAIENYKEAIKADPESSVLTEELAELYVDSGRLREAQSDAEDALKQNPNDLGAHRLLARVFTSQIQFGDPQHQKLDEAMLNKAIEQYQKISQLDPKDADALVMLGRLEKVAQNSAEAEKAYKKALEVDPENEDALTGLAIIYSDLGNSTEAARLLKQLSDKNPSSKSLRALAATYEQMKEYALAAQTLQRALEMSPPDAGDLKHALAEDETQAKDYDGAIKTYQDLVGEDPSDANSLLAMSRIYRVGKHDIAKAREMSDKAKKLEPYNIEVRYNEVGLLQAEGKAAQALTAMKDLVASTERRSYNERERAVRVDLLEELATMEIDADQTEAAVEAYHQIADADPDKGARSEAAAIEAYRAGKDSQKAEQEADAAIKKYPNDSTVHLTHALVLADGGKVDPAVAEVKKFMGPGSDAAKGNKQPDRAYYMALGQIYDRGHKYDDEGKALDAAEKLSDSESDKVDIWFRRGAMLERAKKTEASEAEFQKILQAEPDNDAALNYLGYMFADRGVRLNDALTMINKALEERPGNAAYLDSLGWVYFKLGRLNEAEENVRKALESQPRDATVRDHLGDILMHQGKVRDAVAQWEISLKEWNASSPADLEPEQVAKVKTKLDGAKVRLAKEEKQ
jgi:tetratricopeptide (TPR) repeat protein